MLGRKSVFMGVGNWRRRRQGDCPLPKFPIGKSNTHGATGTCRRCRGRIRNPNRKKSTGDPESDKKNRPGCKRCRPPSNPSNICKVNPSPHSTYTSLSPHLNFPSTTTQSAPPVSDYNVYSSPDVYDKGRISKTARSISVKPTWCGVGRRERSETTRRGCELCGRETWLSFSLISLVLRVAPMACWCSIYSSEDGLSFKLCLERIGRAVCELSRVLLN